jgi:hypothetical protein
MCVRERARWGGIRLEPAARLFGSTENSSVVRHSANEGARHRNQYPCSDMSLIDQPSEITQLSSPIRGKYAGLPGFGGLKKGFFNSSKSCSRIAFVIQPLRRLTAPALPVIINSVLLSAITVSETFCVFNPPAYCIDISLRDSISKRTYR